jgi:hypothetical protein
VDITPPSLAHADATLKIMETRAELWPCGKEKVSAKKRQQSNFLTAVLLQNIFADKEKVSGLFSVGKES